MLLVKLLLFVENFINSSFAGDQLKLNEMKKKLLLALDMLRKDEIASLKGGTTGNEELCGCICLGPLTIVKMGMNHDREVSSSDGDCTDCGASNAHRAANEFKQFK